MDSSILFMHHDRRVIFAQIDPGAAKELINPFWLWIHRFFFNRPWLGVILAQILVLQRNWLIHSGYGFISFFYFHAPWWGVILDIPSIPSHGELIIKLKHYWKMNVYSEVLQLSVLSWWREIPQIIMFSKKDQKPF